MLCCCSSLLLCQVSALAVPSLPRETAIQLTPPKSTRDWNEMASMLVTVFEDSTNGSSAGWEQLGKWFMLKMEQETLLKRYSKTARRMVGKKYAVLLAKEDKDVVGMVELGMFKYNSSSANNDFMLCATVGVLAVLPSYQGQGVGSMLLKRMEELACGGWKEHALYVAVEPDNDAAMRFFRLNNYVEEGRMVPVTVRRNRADKERPHVLLYKNLTITEPSSETASSCQ